MKRILSCLCVLVFLSVVAAVPAMADTYAEVTAPLPDQEVYTGPWQAAYEQILTTYCDGILNYQETLYEAYIDGEYAEVPCRPVALEDLDGDGIPELVFLEFLEDECLGNLYVFTSDADSARCALFIPGVTLLGYDDWLEFRIYMTEDHGEALAVEFYQYETPWILTFARNAENRYELVTCLTYRVDNSGEDEDNDFFRNGENALLAPGGDYAPLILRLADDPALCRRLAENAARDIPVYSWAEIAEQFESYFQSLFLTGLQDYQD